jgi:hypothetical protein
MTEISKEWCINMAKQEEGDIGAGKLAIDPTSDNFHNLPLSESFERVAKVATERQAFNEQAELNDRKAIVAWLRKQYDSEIAAMQSKWAWNDLIFHEAKALAYDHAANAIEDTIQPTQSDALREALEAAPLIGATESAESFKARQDAWLNGQYRAALEQSK